MKRLLCGLLVLAVASCSSNEDPRKASTRAAKKESAFRPLSLDKAVEVAKEEKKVVFIDFYADWCGPCKLLDAQTFSDDRVEKFFKEKAVAIKVDVDREKELARRFQIKYMPTLVFLNAEGKEIGRLVG